MRHIDRYAGRQTMRFHLMVYWVMVRLVMRNWGMG